MAKLSSKAKKQTNEHGPNDGLPVHFRWRNFRAFRDTGRIAFRPITIAIGANNIGKTSLFAPLLILKQTIRSRDRKQALVLAGQFFDAGVATDALFAHSPSTELNLQIDFHVHKDPKLTKLKPLGDYAPGGLSLGFKIAPQTGLLSLSSQEVVDVANRRMLLRKRTRNGFSIDLPSASAKKLTRGIVRIEPRHFLFESKDVLNAILKASKRPSSISIKGSDAMYLEILASIEGQTEELLQRVFHVGPLRASAKRVYTLSGEAPAEVGDTGASTAEFLFRREAKDGFRAQITKWMRRFGLGNNYRFKLADNQTIQLLIKNGAHWVNYADTGSGVAQLLPIIVQGLAMRKGSILLLAQPELHLNPKLQVILAEFVAELAGRDVRTLIETHSEFFLLKTRELIADKKLAANQVNTLFVERKGDESTVRQIPIDDLGNIVAADWPDDFFDESLKGAMALAQAQLRRLKNNDQNARS